MQALAMKVSGMSCGHCVAAVRGALESVEGVVVEQVQVGAVRLRFDGDRTTAGRIAQAIRDEGYEPVLEG